MGTTVEIVETATGNVVERMDATSASDAERIKRGATINLNRDRFHTRIV